MKDVTALIVDDEHKNRETLAKLIEQFCYGVEVIGQAENVQSAKEFIDKHNPQIIFLDIGLKRSSINFFVNKKIKLIETIPIGGYHITKDISNIFKITEADAEKLKKTFNKTDTEFSYKNKSSDGSILISEIINKKISLDLLKKVILYRVQEILDLTLKQLKINNRKYTSEDAELLLIGDGSKLFENNTFYLNDKFGLKSIKIYNETDIQICKCGLKNHIANYESPKIISKKHGIFEKFFNFFDK